MISKKYILFILLLFPLLLFADEDRNLNDYLALSGVMRPIIFRSEFVSKNTLRLLQKNSMMDGYDMFGFPKFQNVVLRRDLAFWETKLAQTKYYARYLNREFKDYILSHPNDFHPDTIRDYAAGFTSRNPKLPDGTELRWHHDRNGYELVTSTEHGDLRHVGGAKTYGYKYAELSREIPNREIILTGQRWAKFTALDLALSTIGLAVSQEKDWKQYVVNAGASVSAGAVAWSVESLLVTSFPLLKGSTPIFIGETAVNIGGPAAWIASGSYILTKYVIIAGWKHYQVETARIIEERCKESETKARFQLLKEKAELNTAQLEQLLQTGF